MADFNELLKVLRREKPSRPVLFEIFMNEELYAAALGPRYVSGGYYAHMLSVVYAFEELGYDYATVQGRMAFPGQDRARAKTHSLNGGAAITDRASFDRYGWPEPGDFEDDAFDRLNADMPRGMKLMVMGPGGVLENVIGLTGFDNLCMMLYDDEQLVYDLFEQIGSRLLRYYELALRHRSVGLIMSNDDWGFKTQTMLSPADMRRFVFPWHKKIAEAAHAAGLPAVLHSCGYFEEILGDLFALGFDARHSYEDNITPVERAYDMLIDRMAVLGGIDLDFLIRSAPEAVTARAKAMLAKTGSRGYALGSGNSIPEYVPFENYYAMTRAAREEEGSL